ncbi:MAG: DUF1549 domain-containing protein [Pirellulales bacterium]
MIGALLVASLCSLDPSYFDLQVVPLLTRVGCNSGACHGAAAGRGGFRLSLLGADPDADYDAIVHALEGRRVHLAAPARSLFLLKPTGQIDHGGGSLFAEDSPEAQRLLRWLAGGAPRGATTLVRELRVEPRQITVDATPAAVPLKVVALIDNVSAPVALDVSELAQFQSADPAAVDIDDQNTARITRRGSHIVLVRYRNHIVPVTLRVPWADAPAAPAAAPPIAPQRADNFIDQEVARVHRELRITPAPLADDAAFLRRATLDLTGRLPTPEAVERYLADPLPAKRYQLLDELLQSEAFVDVWTLRLARWLRLHALPNDVVAPTVFGRWIREQVAADAGWDSLTRELLLADGDSHSVGPANFARMVGDARGHAELVAETFLGARLGCANCHDHPLDRWTQDDYHGLAAVFAKLDRGRRVQLLDRGAVTNLRTGEPAVPRIPGVRDLPGTPDPRRDFADWLVAEGRPALARAYVNRLWKVLFGRGLIDPVDDLRPTNPATHPELLDRLTESCLQHQFRLRPLLRQMAASDAYARATLGADEPAYRTTYLAAAARRPLEPEVLADAVVDVTLGGRNSNDAPTDRRYVEWLDPLVPAPSLDLLGRCSRAAGCDAASALDRGLAARLHLLNGDFINQRLASADGRLAQELSRSTDDARLIREFMLRTWSRPPTDDESRRWTQRLHSDDPAERRRRFEDFIWSLLNSRDFRENH